jgi:hypothetical protein
MPTPPLAERLHLRAYPTKRRTSVGKADGEQLPSPGAWPASFAGEEATPIPSSALGLERYALTRLQRIRPDSR